MPAVLKFSRSLRNIVFVRVKSGRERSCAPVVLHDHSAVVTQRLISLLEGVSTAMEGVWRPADPTAGFSQTSYCSLLQDGADFQTGSCSDLQTGVIRWLGSPSAGTVGLSDSFQGLLTPQPMEISVWLLTAHDHCSAARAPIPGSCPLRGNGPCLVPMVGHEPTILNINDVKD